MLNAAGNRMLNAAGVAEIYPSRHSDLYTRLAELYRHPGTSALTLKTCTLESREGNPHTYKVSCDAKLHTRSFNNVALHNDGLEETMRRVQFLRGLQVVPHKLIVVSLWGSPDEMIPMLRELEGLKPGNVWIEWNLSCPNVEHEPNVHDWLLRYSELATRTSHKLGIKVAENLSPNNQPDFVTAINTLVGYGGFELRDGALTTIKKWRTYLGPEVPIIAAGGATVDERGLYIKAGATVVSLGTEVLSAGLGAFNDAGRSRALQSIRLNLVSRGKKVIELKSGQISTTYVDCRLAPSMPLEFACLITEWLRVCRTFPPFDLVCGVPTGGVPWATALALYLSKPLIVCRATPKTHGNRKLVEGKFKNNQRVLVVEDVVTTGQSALKIVENLARSGLIPCCVTCLVHRGSIVDWTSIGDRTNPIPLASVFTLDEIEDESTVAKTPPVRPQIIRLQRLISEKKSNLCWAADLTDSTRIRSILEQIGSRMVVLKIHTDAGFPLSPQEVQALKAEYGFMILLDRKFADIDKTVKAQLRTLMAYEPDFVTSHAVAGAGSLEALGEYGVGVVLVASMSSTEHRDPILMDQCATMALSKPYVCGVVSQEYMGPDILHWVPGIHPRKTHDGYQNYRTTPPSWADVIIVGRAVSESENPARVVENLLM